MPPPASTFPRIRSQPADGRTSAPRTPSSRRAHPRTSYSGQPILAIRAHTSQRRAAQFVHDALRELHAFIHTHDLQPAGSPFTIVNHSFKRGTLDIEVVWPIEQVAAGAGRIHGGTLPTPFASHPVQRSRGDRSALGPIDVLF